jgi:hypothetical protein
MTREGARFFGGLCGITHGGFFVPRGMALDIEAATEAWNDLDFLQAHFPASLRRFTTLKDLVAFRRSELRTAFNA